MYLLAVVGKQVNSNNTTIIVGEESHFNFCGKSFEKTIEFDVKQVLKDISTVSEFLLLEKTNHFEPEICYLGVFLNPRHCIGKITRNNQLAKRRLCNWLFRKQNGDELFENTSSAVENNPTNNDDTDEYFDVELSLSSLFRQLKDTRSKFSVRINDLITDSIQHPYLIPTLREYQADAVKWLLYRERISDHFPTEFLPINPIEEYVSFIGSSYIVPTLYYNPRTIEVTDENPCDIKLPSGGILADEMGLGKTVEMLSLILLNKKRKRKLSEICFKEPVIHSVEPSVDTILCLCGNNRMRHRKRFIICSKCLKYQHKKCVLKFSTDTAEETNTSYICPNCWKCMDTIDSSATIIVSPVAIKKQWESEISKHVTNKNFKVLIYDGVKSTGWISPTDMAKYDIVLTDYNVMKSEIYFTNSNERQSLRNEKRYLNPISPLPYIKWWRVCLDEAQMIESTGTLGSQMVKTLPTTHRWSVTGTPIQKKIDNLQGLLYFLDCYPYTELTAWSKLSTAYYNGNAQPLLDVLEKIMWRTCKADVLDQINIPPQNEIVHYVAMSDLEAFFYKMQHGKYYTAFNETAVKWKNRKNLAMSNMDPHTLKLLMEPLRKIRQDCTAPSIFRRVNTNNPTTKKILTPSELLAHLIANNEVDGKSELRSIVSCLNGLAGIHIIQEDYAKASKLYTNVLSRAKEQSSGNITVDTLQQIHAIYNLVTLIENKHVNDVQLHDLKQKHGDLEWKYINSYYILVHDCEVALEKTQLSIKNTTSDIEYMDGNWWRDILYSAQGTPSENQLLDKIRSDLNEAGTAITEEISSVRGLDYVISSWWDNLLKARTANIKTFKSLDFFTKNIKPKHLLKAEEYDHIKRLINEALECHLNYDIDNDNDKDSRKAQKPKKKKELCEICKAKNIMLKYECLVFNKTFRDDGDTEGSWNPPFQERIIKGIFNFSKLKRNENDLLALQEGEHFLELMEEFKKEYKDYSKLWVEINYTVSGYDELNMCKSRLEIIDPMETELPNLRNKKSFISIHEISLTEQELQDQLIESENKFIQIRGRLKYLQHLESKNEPDVCPICTKKPESKYAVLQCGHIICLTCLLQMQMYQQTRLTCCVCRNKQNYRDVSYVRCKDVSKSDAITLIGDHSSKIEEIIRTVLQLVNKEPDVKIIIFSQWENILGVLALALKDNFINYRTKSSKIHVCIEAFKNSESKITCLLLPLQFGSKGLNLIEATHVFLVEPILNPGEELQAIGRVHRIGQTKLTYVHKFIVKSTIEETIHKTISKDEDGKWRTKRVTIKNLQDLFKLEDEEILQE